MKLDPFYLIVDSSGWIERLVPLGVRLVQLRIKQMDEAPLRAEIRRSAELCRRHGAGLVVNDYWRLAIEEVAAADLGIIRRAGLKFGVSTHDDDELARALAARPDYVALGPIYPTILKKMKWAPQGIERLALWKERIGKMPLVAIGGLRPDRLAGVFENGADSAAVVTDIVTAADPEGRTRAWIDATRAYA